MFQELFCSLGFSFICEEFVSFQAKCELHMSSEFSSLFRMKKSCQLWDSSLRKMSLASSFLNPGISWEGIPCLIPYCCRQALTLPTPGAQALTSKLMLGHPNSQNYPDSAVCSAQEQTMDSPGVSALFNECNKSSYSSNPAAASLAPENLGFVK